VGTYPTGITVLPLTNHVFTADQLSSTSSVVDGTGFRLLGHLNVQLSPTDAEANIFTGHVFVSNQDSATVTVIDDS
jgi:DNA-binding beta-propeller fold protein YncE